MAREIFPLLVDEKEKRMLADAAYAERVSMSAYLRGLISRDHAEKFGAHTTTDRNAVGYTTN